MRAHIPIVTLVLLLTPAVVPGLTAATANAEVITVCWDGSGDYLTIQEGIDAASDGDEVVVCDGTYTGAGNKNVDFGGKAITVRSENGPESCIINCQDDEYGFRFHSSETEASVVSGITIMGADASAVDCSAASPTITNCTMAGNRRGLTGVPSSSAVANCRISGNQSRGLSFEGPSCSPMISNCMITGNGGQGWDGGGIYCCNGSATISNCMITGNTGDEGGAVCCYDVTATITECHLSANNADCGAGVFCDGGSVTISNCTITANTARSGGAVFCYVGSHTITDSAITGNTASHGGGISCEASSPTIVNCTITANTVLEDEEGYGGAIYCVAGSNPMISDCMIMGNAALFGGGVYCDDSSPMITNCVIAVNGDEECYGGGIFSWSRWFESSPTITDCTIMGNTAWDGAGIYCWDASPTIADCTIMGNTADYGGGFYCRNSTATIANCTIVANTADGGGGVECSEGSLTIANCVIAGNTAEHSSGGAVSCFGTSVMISDCTITGNTATLGAGGLLCDAGSLTISYCTISENTGHYDGSAVACHENSPMIINCSITGNAGGVGALSCWGASPTITNCTISGNATTGVCCFVSNATITNSSITGNTGYAGGGIWCHQSTATITNCTVAGNTTLEAGGGLLCTGEGSVTATNCILWGDSASQGPEIGVGAGATLTVTYNDVEGGQDAAYVQEGSTLNWGPGNIDADPLFVDPDGPDDDPNTWEDNDFHLSPGSPCLDAGCNWAVPPDAADLDDDGDTSEITPLDLDGEGRFFDDPDTVDTGCGCPPIVDMGAYEFGDTGAQPCPGDLDCDRVVGHSDLAILLAAWHSSAEGDLNCDGVTDHADLGLLLGNWGEICP